MRKAIIYLVIFLLLLGTPTGIRCWQFYRLGGKDVTPPPAYDPQQVSQVSAVPTPEANLFVDEPTVGEGAVLLDIAHANNFTADELNYLDGRLSARGFEIVPYPGGDLANMLRDVTAFIVITPLEKFSTAQIQAVRDFVARGGRLLLVGDPTRFTVTFIETDFDFTYTIDQDDIALNSLSNEFNISFNGDYLYNTVQNEGNFRNIILQDEALAEDSLTDGLTELAFYSAHSLEVGRGGDALLTADDNTWSSATDRAGGLVVAATAAEGKVLALGDIHFLLEPYYTVYDNSQFIAHIADFLTEASERELVLGDFPYFFRTPLDMVYIGTPELGPDAFDEIIALQEKFRQAERPLRLVGTPDITHDTLYLGLYNQADELAEILASANLTLTIDPPMLTADEVAAQSETDNTSEDTITDTIRLVESPLGKVQMSGTAVILLHQQESQRQVIVLAASSEGLENTVNRLLDLIPLNADYALADCLIQDNLALCPTNINNEDVEAELLSGGVPDTHNGSGNDNGSVIPGLDALEQGSIGLDETVSATLGEAERHAWTFSDGPDTINIILESPDLDAVLELYGPDGELWDSVDSGLTGDPEILSNIEIPDDGDYTILVRDFWDVGGDYTLTVEPAGSGGSADTGNGEANGLTNIFIVADDDGLPLTDGFTSASALADLLSDTHSVTIWSMVLDGELPPDALDNVDLLIWDSGDYRDEDGVLDAENEVLFNYMDAGGRVWFIGASPTLFSYLEMSDVSDLEVVGDDPILLDGLTEGDVIELDQTYPVVIPDGDLEPGENDTVFLVRGPASENDGSLAAVAGTDATPGGQGMVVMLFPFTALPFEVQQQLLTNLITWLGFTN